MTKHSKLEKEWAASILYSLVTDTKQRLGRGAKFRQEMLAQIKAGKNPEGYRADWIRNSAKIVMILLTKIAEKFNEEYPTDQCSADDLADVLATASGMLNRAAARPQQQPAEPNPKSQA